VGDGSRPAWEGMTWILDLLPHWPRSALEVVGAYELAHAQQLPDGRIGGLEDIQAIIRAKWLEVLHDPQSADRKQSSLLSLTSREFEHLIEGLYHAMGYETKLTPARRDGGRDIEAAKRAPSEKQLVLVECKRYAKTVGVEIPRALLGMVSHENVNKGVIVTTGRFTRGSQRLAQDDHRLELLDGHNLIALLDAHVGPRWENQLDSLIQGSRRRNGDP
jgi:restriction system protein